MVCLSKYRSISKSTLFNEGGTKQWTIDRTVALRSGGIVDFSRVGGGGGGGRGQRAQRKHEW